MRYRNIGFATTSSYSGMYSGTEVDFRKRVGIWPLITPPVPPVVLNGVWTTQTDMGYTTYNAIGFGNTNANMCVGGNDNGCQYWNGSSWSTKSNSRSEEHTSELQSH